MNWISEKGASVAKCRLKLIVLGRNVRSLPTVLTVDGVVCSIGARLLPREGALATSPVAPAQVIHAASVGKHNINLCRPFVMVKLIHWLLPLHVIPTFIWGRCVTIYASM